MIKDLWKVRDLIFISLEFNKSMIYKEKYKGTKLKFSYTNIGMLKNFSSGAEVIA